MPNNFFIDPTVGEAPINDITVIELATIRKGTVDSPVIKGINIPSSDNKGINNSAIIEGQPVNSSTDLAGEMAPHLNSFDIDLSSTVKTLTLRFSKPVDPTSLDVTKVTIQDAATAVLSRVLSDSTCSAVTLSSTITIDLGTNDYAYLTGTAGLADSQAHTWLTLAASAILDGSDISNDVIADGSGMQVTSYTSP